MPKGWIKRPHDFTAPQILIGTFLGLIVLGTFLLMLPFAFQLKSLSFIDALFTATSAVCVTGLTVVNTNQFTTFGQVVILIFIQLGGLGLMTFSTAFLLMVGRSPSMRSRLVLHETLTPSLRRDPLSLVKSILLFTFLIEGIGALILFLRWIGEYPVSKAGFLATFHAVSAFCNAGFTLFTQSFIEYRGDYLINLTVILLIFLGGIGFLVINEIYSRLRERHKRKIWSLDSKLTLITTLCLVLFGTWVFFVLEYHNALRDLAIDKKILASVFQSVRPRTAGFNSVDFGTLTEPVLLIWILFMFIGASPGSCGGGIKTTTLAVFLASVRSQLRGEENVSCMHRTLPLQTVSRMVSVMAVGSLVLIVSTILLVYVQSSGVAIYSDPGGLFLGYVFEAASAFGTVGLSTGVTSLLTPLGKVIIMCLMFLGRVGPLTLALSIQPKEKSRGVQYSEENVMIG